MAEQPKINVFISYAHEDRNYRLELNKWLDPVFCPQLNVWDDGQLALGGEWDDAIKKNLEQSKIVLLLISADFLLSKYIRSVELKSALERHKQKQCRVIPLFVRSCAVEKFPEIVQLQGFPRDMRFLSSIDKGVDELYTQLQTELQELAETELKLEAAKAQNNEQGTMANAIDELRTKRKIFLSVPDTPEAKRKRKDLVIETDGWIKYDGWPYEIVPGIRELQEIEKMTEDQRKAFYSSLLKESIYSIHIMAAENDLKEGSGKMQYDLAKGRDGAPAVFKSIAWVQQAGVPVDNEIKMQNALFSGEEYGDLKALIEAFDADKEKAIEEGKKAFYPNKRIYIYSLYQEDYSKALRIKLKREIEKEKYCVRWNIKDEKEESIDQELASCEGAIIFYGSADFDWFNASQSRLLGVKSLRTRGVCLDEPDIDVKFERDVSENEFVAMREADNLSGLKHFLKPLQS